MGEKRSYRAGADVLIAGAGIIGLSTALELEARGARVLVVERDTALSHASTAAAGMLAVHDPYNPPQLLPLSQLSASLYPAYLRRIASLSGVDVRFQTDVTVQAMPLGSTRELEEHSLDPRQLAAALLAAVRATSIELREHTPLSRTEERMGVIAAITADGERLAAHTIVNTAGAWASSIQKHWPPVVPVKGQMLRVALPDGLRSLAQVHRDERVYVVPRTQGPQAGSAIVGATIERAGFDTTTHPADLARLRTLAASLLPALADKDAAPMIEAWAGIRPGTPDDLPIIAAASETGEIIAAGHYRNGILLAPATAALVADVIQRKPLPIDLTPFSLLRFAGSTAPTIVRV